MKKLLVCLTIVLTFAPLAATRPFEGQVIIHLDRPVLISLSPNNGTSATSVTITGQNFGPTQDNGTVTFNGTSATVSSWAPTSITVTVPVGATTGNVLVSRGGFTTNALPFTINSGIVQFRTCTTTTANLTQATIQTAINAASDGAVICLPAGSATWTTALTIGSASTRTKMVTLQGAGSGSNPATNTVITANNTTVQTDGQCCPVIDAHLLFSLTGHEVSNIRFIQGSSWRIDTAGEEAVWGIRATGNADTQASEFRWHHLWAEYNTVTFSGAQGVNGDDKFGSYINFGRLGGNGSRDATLDVSHVYIFGSIDHNTLHGAGSFQCWDIMPFSGRDFNSPTNGIIQESNVGGILAWETPLSDHQGTYKGVFVEDNTISSTHWQNNNACGDGQAGSVQIWRHNTITNNWMGNHGYEDDLSAKWFDIHDNIIIINASSSEINGGGSSASNNRGGTGVVHENAYYDGAHKGTGNPYGITGDGTFSSLAELQYYRGSVIGEARGPAGTGCVKLCNDFTTGPVGCDNHDIISGTRKGYICGGQPGAKKGAITPGTLWGYLWAIEPMVAWSNTYGDVASTVWDNTSAEPLMAERSEYLDFDSCNAPNASNPTCLTWWDAANHKKVGYVDYTYPHPRTQ